MLKFTAVAMLVVLGGCSMNSPLQRVKNSQPAPAQQTPLVVDGAMQTRDWNRSTAGYANGNTVAGPTGFLYESRWNQQPEWVYIFEESPLFTGQTLALPITMTLTPPWTPILYKGSTVEPSYTAMPPLTGNLHASPSR